MRSFLDIVNAMLAAKDVTTKIILQQEIAEREMDFAEFLDLIDY
jgi:hypothetical protein